MKTALVSARLCLIVFTTIAMGIFIAKAPADSAPGPAAGLTRASQPVAPAIAPPVAPPTSQPVMTVKIDNFEFIPKEMTIPVGTTITWQNVDDVPHTATSKDEPQTFDSGALDTDDKFSFTFTKPGKYAYYCKVHPHMTGTITVK